MTDTRDPQSNEAETPLPSDELVPEDDSIIGKALKGSLLALLIVGVFVALGAYLLRRSQPPVAETTIESTAPEVLPQNVQIPPQVRFTDITASAGLGFVHFNGARGDKFLPETMGSGAAFFDFDNDDDADLFLVNGAAWPGDPQPTPRPTCALYRNDGSGHFEDVTLEFGLDLSLYGTGVAVGDYNGDGRIDLFLAAVGANRLFENQGDRFRDVTHRADVAGASDAWSTSAAFFDADNDGKLDLFVGNYVRWSQDIDLQLNYRLTGVGRAYGPPVNYEGAFSYLYRNNGDGTFADVSEASGLHVRNPATDVPIGKALGVQPVDIDGDGWLDLLIANDTVQNFFFHNRSHDSTGISLAELGELYGLAYGRNGEATGAMGVDAGYYRNDGELGFAIGNFANEMTSLYLSQGDPTLYADEAIGEGVGAPSRTLLSFGVLFFDYDLDSRLDLLQVNGHLENEINTVDPSQTYEQPTQIFWNAGSTQRQSFVDVPLETAGDLAQPTVGRGSAVADIDGDGDLDVLITQTGRPPLLLRNDQELNHHWVRLKLLPLAGRSSIGTRIELTSGGVTQRRQVMPTRSYQSQSELPVTFGLGASSSVESLSIVWPDGSRETLDSIPINQLVVLRQSEKSPS